MGHQVSDSTAFVSVTDDGVTVTSNEQSAEQITESIKPEGAPTEEEKVSKAASELGKKGGEAAAAVKRADAKKRAKNEKQAAADLAEPGVAADGQDDRPLGTDPDQDAEPEKPLGKPRDDPRARMLEATRQAAEAKRERDAIRQEKERLAAEVAQLRAGKPQEQPQPAPQRLEKPVATDFEDYEQYLDARDKYNRQEWQREQASEQYVRQYVGGLITHVETFEGRLTKALEADPELQERVPSVDQVVRNSSHMVPPGQKYTAFNVVNDEIISSESPALLLDHLGNNPEEMKKLLALPNRTAIARQVAKIEGRLTGTVVTPSDERPAKQEVSHAKPPVRPVSGSPHSAESAPGEDDSYEAHRAYWGRRDKERSARR